MMKDLCQKWKITPIFTVPERILWLDLSDPDSSSPLIYDRSTPLEDRKNEEAVIVNSADDLPYNNTKHEKTDIGNDNIEAILTTEIRILGP